MAFNFLANFKIIIILGYLKGNLRGQYQGAFLFNDSCVIRHFLCICNEVCVKKMLYTTLHWPQNELEFI